MWYAVDSGTGDFDVFLPTPFVGEAASIRVKVTTFGSQVILKNDSLEYFIPNWGMMLLQTTYNTFIDSTLFLDGSAKFFQGYDSKGNPTSGTNLIIPKTEEDLSNTLLLAFVIGYFGGSNGYDDWWYGWIEFGYIDGEVRILNSALEEVLRQGIRAGVIPEPSTSLLALSGIALLLRRRRTRVA